MDKYMRHPLFWERTDGDINAVPVDLGSGRAVNSDVMSLMGSRLSATPLGRYAMNGVPKRFSKQRFVYDDRWAGLQNREAVLRYLERYKGQAGIAEVCAFISSLDGLDGLPEDEQYENFLYASRSKRERDEKWKSDKRTHRSISMLLWGGQEIFVTDPSLSVPAFKKFYTPPALSIVSSGRLMTSQWRMDEAVSYREMAVLASLVNRHLGKQDISLNEVLYLARHERELVVFLSSVRDYSRNEGESEAEFARTLNSFRSVVSDDSALMWTLALARTFGRDAGFAESALDYDYHETKRNLLQIARAVPYYKAAGYLAAGIVDVEAVKGGERTGSITTWRALSSDSKCKPPPDHCFVVLLQETSLFFVAFLQNGSRALLRAESHCWYSWMEGGAPC